MKNILVMLSLVGAVQASVDMEFDEQRPSGVFYESTESEEIRSITYINQEEPDTPPNISEPSIAMVLEKTKMKYHFTIGWAGIGFYFEIEKDVGVFPKASPNPAFNFFDSKEENEDWVVLRTY